MSTEGGDMMTTLIIETSSGRKVFQNVTRYWKTSLSGNVMNAQDHFTPGTLEVTFDGGKTAFVDCSTIKSFTLSQE